MNFAVGDQVAVVQERRSMGGSSYRRAVVEKVGKRDLVLGDGSRWQLDGRRRRSERSKWGLNPRVRHLDDPVAVRVRAEIVLVRLRARVVELAKSADAGACRDALAALDPEG
jgi:hypothetical protein